MVIANNVIKISYIKMKIDNMQKNSKCSLCGLILFGFVAHQPLWVI